MSCEGIIDADILADCDNALVGGLETDVLLFNRQDINLDAITYDASNKVLCTNFELLSGKVGFLLEGVKQVNSTAFELVKKDNGTDKKKHIFNGLILTPSAANKLQLENMSEGADFVAIVNKKWKGAENKEAFEIFGLDSGLQLQTATYNSNENDGAILFTLANPDGYEEPKIPLTLLETDYPTTLALFNAKFIEA